MRSIHRLVAAGLALVLVIVATSAFIRLSQPGLSPPGGSAIDVARAAHRIAASAAGLLFVLIAALGWDHWRGDSRRFAALALLALAGLLAWLGRYTPSDLTAVTLGNLLGGMALLGLLAWLWRPDAPGGAPLARMRFWIAAGLALVALLIASGGLIGADQGLADASRQALHLAHGSGALLLTALLAWIGLRHARLRDPRRALGVALLGLAAMQVALGAALPSTGFPVALAVAHNALAALVLVVLASLLARAAARETPA